MLLGMLLGIAHLAHGAARVRTQLPAPLLDALRRPVEMSLWDFEQLGFVVNPPLA
ncbi:MAG: hypothetical protein OXN89_03505 [Bryobacterales bacterium]|nr:hypothetical protein [Bryobacterales bacterium]